MNKGKKTAIFIFGVIMVGIVSAAISLYQFTVGSGCLLLAWTGIPCPTCGMTRATYCMISGRFSEAFEYHPLFWAPYLTVVLGLACVPKSRWRRVFVYCIAALLIAFIAVWWIRVACFDWRG